MKWSGTTSWLGLGEPSEGGAARHISKPGLTACARAWPETNNSTPKRPFNTKSSAPLSTHLSSHITGQGLNLDHRGWGLYLQHFLPHRAVELPLHIHPGVSWFTPNLRGESYPASNDDLCFPWCFLLLQPFVQLQLLREERADAQL